MKQVRGKNWLAISAVLLLMTGCQSSMVKEQFLATTSIAPSTAAQSAELLATNPELSAVYFFVPKLRFDNALNNTVTGEQSQLEIKQNNQTIAKLPPLGMLKLELLPEQRYQLSISETANPYWVKQVAFEAPKEGRFSAYDAYTTLLNFSDYPVFEQLDLNATLERLNTHSAIQPAIADKQIALTALGLEQHFDSCFDPNQQNQCQQLISQFPAEYVPVNVTASLEKMAAAEQLKQEEQQRKQTLVDMEAALPAEVRRDKYMVQLASALKEERYQDALTIFPKLESLSLQKDPSLDFFYGETLLKTKQPAEALKHLYHYVSQQGSGATHYARALELINQAENQL